MNQNGLNTAELHNYTDMLKDVLAGDTDLVDKAYLEAAGLDNLKIALEWLKANDPYGDYKNVLANEGWRLTYYRKPPTPEEFLTYEWIGPQAEGLWPNVRKCFLEFMDPNPMNPARYLALSTSIGWGKAQPLDSRVAVKKNIEIELDDNIKLKIPSDDLIEVEENGEITKIVANDLLSKNLDTIDFPQPLIKLYGV